MNKLPKRPRKISRGAGKREDGKVKTPKVHLPQDMHHCEIALSFDHILEQIFSSLETSHLLTCRLVSRRFLKFAQVPLGKQLDLSFFNYKLSGRWGDERAGRQLEQLTNFLKQSSSKSKPHSFPCTYFYFSGSELGDKDLQSFLNTNGTNIRRLYVSKPYSKGIIHENILMDQVSNLLTRQAPNLELLSISMNPIVGWEHRIPHHVQGQGSSGRGPPIRRNRLLKTDPEFKQISSRVKSLQSKSCLKDLKIDGDGLAKVLEFLFQLCPKLEEVRMSCANLIHLLSPVSRVYLLKKLRFHPEMLAETRGTEYRFSMTVMEKISMDAYLRLTELSIDFRDTFSVWKSKTEIRTKVILSINRILDSSRETLELLELNSVSFLPGMKMPSCMPKLGTIQISEFNKEEDGNTTVFPNEFCWSETFPKLTCVKLCCSYGACRNNKVFAEIVSCLDFQADGEYSTLSLGVKNIIVDQDCLDTPPRSPPSVPAKMSRRIQKLFPNASIKMERF